MNPLVLGASAKIYSTVPPLLPSIPDTGFSCGLSFYPILQIWVPHMPPRDTLAHSADAVISLRGAYPPSTAVAIRGGSKGTRALRDKNASVSYSS